LKEYILAIVVTANAAGPELQTPILLDWQYFITLVRFRMGGLNTRLLAGERGSVSL